MPAVEDFAGWRAAARGLLLRGVPPEEAVWTGTSDEQPLLLPPVREETQPAPAAKPLTIPRAFLQEAETAACHSDPGRWALLYRIAWRIHRGQRHLLEIESDPDVCALRALCKAVGRDIHKMRAFVRFRAIRDDAGERYVAWYRPDHDIVEANAKFFVNRFGAMRWAILTPYRSIVWDLRELHTGPGVPRSQAPPEDELEDLWRAYYASVFNPARLNLTAMRSEMPVKRWSGLPEAQLIPQLVRESRGRVDEMAEKQSRSATAFIPRGASLAVLREEVRHCTACEACGRASGAVFGEGPADARIVLVGEQPGDEEDRAGRPFVGPAGQVLDRALQSAGLERSGVYVTNAVKAFRFEERGKRRIHQTPRTLEIAICRPWLEAEIAALDPEVIVCLGGSAAQSILGRAVRIGAERGKLLPHQGRSVAITYHPSAILRAPDPQAQAVQFAALAADLGLAARAVGVPSQ